MLTVKLYEYSGTYIKDIKTDAPKIKRSRGQEIRSTASFSAPAEFLQDLKKLGRRIKIIDENSKQWFSGYIDDVKPSVSSSAWLDVSCRDKSKVFKLAGFAADTTYADASVTDTTLTITSASGSTTLQAGDAVQGRGKVYGRTLQANVLGITSEVTPDSESGNSLTGNYSIAYSVDGLNLLTITFYVDLMASIALDAITVTTNGTAATPEISTDGETFADFASGTTGRYIKIVIAKASGPITAGIVCTADAASAASNVMVDDAAYWSPRPTDLSRELTLVFASGSVNGLNIKVGVNDSDRETCYKADIDLLVSGTWTRAATDQILNAGLNRIAFTAATATKMRITFKAGTKPVAVRFCEVKYVDASVTLDQIIEAILTTEGETDFALIQSTLALPADNAITFEAGESKLKSCTDLAESISWEFYYDENDKPVFRPLYWFDQTGTILEIEAMLQWSPVYSDADIYNVVLAKYESGDASLSSVATNDSGASATSTINIGTRTSPVLVNSLANTQDKLDAWTQEQLARYSLQTISASCCFPALYAGVYIEYWDDAEILDDTHSIDEAYLFDEDGNAAQFFEVIFDATITTVFVETESETLCIRPIEPGQVVHITDTITAMSDLFAVQSCELVEGEKTIDWNLEVVQL